MKIGFLVDSQYIPSWAFEAIKEVLRLKDIDVLCIIISKNETHPQNSLYNRYKTWDTNNYKPRYLALGEDAFAIKNIQDCLPKSSVIDIHQDTDMLQTLDVLIHLSGHLVHSIPIPTNGIWYYQLGPQESVGFWETYYDTGTIEATLRAKYVNPVGPRANLQERVLKETILAEISSPISELQSPALTHNIIAWDCAPLLYLCLKKLLETGNPELNKTQHNTPSKFSTKNTPPNTLNTLMMVGKFIIRYLQTMPRLFTTQYWTIYFSTAPIPPLRKKKFIKLESPKGVYWADPFPISVNQKNYILFEEYIYKKNKGVLKAIEIGKDNSVNNSTPVLEENFHISFPFVFFEEDTLYLMPEAAESKALTLYQCIEFPNQWEKVSVLLEDRFCYDSVLLKKDGKWWLFVTEKLMDNGSCYVYGNLYFSDSLFAPFQAHPMNPISTDCRYTRAGGRIIHKDGDYFRVAQDCSKGYGYKINFLKIKTLTETVYEEEYIGDINPERLGSVGFHTLNTTEILTTVDTRKKAFKFLHR